MVLPFLRLPQGGAATGVVFFPDTCEVGLYSLKMGIVKESFPDPDAGPARVDWEWGFQGGFSVEVELAGFTGPGQASAESFDGIFWTIQGSCSSGTSPIGGTLKRV